MNAFVTGATGLLARQSVPHLAAGGGHEVVGTTRSESKQDLVRSLAARPVLADGLNSDAVAQAGRPPSPR
jgi:nucleoside-diphosphate-sugar epimerase